MARDLLDKFLVNPIKRMRCLFALFITLIGAFAAHGESHQTADAQHLLDLVKEIQLGQLELIDNQGKIDTKITELAESIRLARIEAARVGGKHIPPPKM